ncbi:MAG: glycerol-3-phosphate dehydrogenase/oxidase [Microthrixaceae bacterium]
MTPQPFVRSTSIQSLKDREFDLVVVGGGITGVGVALDAASRGLRTALIERDDFASGTSSKSSKLIHGGLRYLQQGEIGLVYEALAERQRLLKNAPHLVKPLPFLIPMFGKNGIIPAKISRVLGAAMWGYDLTGGLRIGKRHKRLNKAEALDYMPSLREDRLVSAYLYYDAAADDARLVVAIARTAALDHGAVIANRVASSGFTKDSGGRINGLKAVADGEEFTIRTRSVVNATGVWADDIKGHDSGTSPDTIRPAKGIHISVPWQLIRNEIAAVIPVPHDRRSVFVVPHGDLTYIGTTDTDYTGPLDDPQCTPDDIEYLLKAINTSCATELTAADVTGSWAGLRPLVKSASSGRTADLSRKHRIDRSNSGLVSITGGKLTTYREMAADTVDEVIESVLSRQMDTSRFGSSTTKKMKIRGAAGYQSLDGARKVYPDVPSATVNHLKERYGGESRVMMAAIQADPTLGEPLVDGLPYVRAEAIFAVRNEMANSVDDVLARRTRARIYSRDDSAAAAESVGALIAGELGWSDEQREASVAEYRRLVEHERVAADLPETHFSEHPSRTI